MLSIPPKDLNLDDLKKKKKKKGFKQVAMSKQGFKG